MRQLGDTNQPNDNNMKNEINENNVCPKCDEETTNPKGPCDSCIEEVANGLGIPEEVVREYALDIGDDDLSDIDEAYSGRFSTDEDFARDMADNLGQTDSNLGWPHNCIDWEFAAQELMQDYFEINGYYFRHI